MTEWLIDTSALARLTVSAEAGARADRIDRGLVRISVVTRLEVGCSARSGRALRSAARQPPLASMPIEYQTRATEDRAVAMQAPLADLGQHRAPSVPDLIVAATAELAGLMVVHVNKDFDLIAEITGQATKSLAVADKV